MRAAVLGMAKRGHADMAARDRRVRVRNLAL